MTQMMRLNVFFTLEDPGTKSIASGQPGIQHGVADYMHEFLFDLDDRSVYEGYEARPSEEEGSHPGSWEVCVKLLVPIQHDTVGRRRSPTNAIAPYFDMFLHKVKLHQYFREPFGSEAVYQAISKAVGHHFKNEVYMAVRLREMEEQRKEAAEKWEADWEKKTRESYGLTKDEFRMIDNAYPQVYEGSKLRDYLGIKYDIKTGFTHTKKYTPDELIVAVAEWKYQREVFYREKLGVGFHKFLSMRGVDRANILAEKNLHWDRDKADLVSKN